MYLMKLLLDSKEFLKDPILAYVALAVLLVFFVFVDLLFLFLDVSDKMGFIESENAPSLVFVFFSNLLVFLVFAFMLKIRGEIFKTPLKILDEGLSVHSNLIGFEPEFVPFGKIKSMTLGLEWGIAGIKDSGLRIIAKEGGIHGQEKFSSKEKFEEYLRNLQVS